MHILPRVPSFLKYVAIVEGENPGCASYWPWLAS